jgi:hypothetical protein
MKNIASASVLIRDEHGTILFIIDNYKKLFNEQVIVNNEEYYQIGSTLIINKKQRTIRDIQFIYRAISSDFQTVITVNAEQ